MASHGNQSNLQQLAERKMDAALQFKTALRDLEQRHHALAEAEYRWSAACLAMAGKGRDGGMVQTA